MSPLLEKFKLPSPISSCLGLGNWRDLSIASAIPQVQPVRDASVSVDHYRKMAVGNLGHLSTIFDSAPAVATPKALADWIQACHRSNNLNYCALQLLLATVDNWLFSNVTSYGFGGRIGFESKEDALNLVVLLDRHNGIRDSFSKLPQSKALMQASWKSRGSLVKLVVYCEVFALCSRLEKTIMRDYGVAIDWREVEHLVLDDKLAIDCAKCVSGYLNQRQKDKKALFSLEPCGSELTGDFAHRICTESAEYKDSFKQRWQEQRKLAAEREERYWGKGGGKVAGGQGS